MLVANWILVTQFLAMTEEQRQALPTVTWDKFAAFMTGVMIDGKFFTIFSMLFGLGLAVQLARASSAGRTVLPTYTRRLMLLLAMGVLHGMLLWYGDVLHRYALLGFLLIVFARLSDRCIARWIVGILLFLVLRPVAAGIAESAGSESWMLFGRVVEVSERSEITRHGSYADILRMNWDIHLQDYGEVAFGRHLLFWYVDIFSKFLLGYLIGRRMLLQSAREHLSLFRRVLPWALLIGLGGNLYMNLVWVYDIGRVEHALVRDVLRGVFELCVVALALGYVCLLVLLHEQGRFRVLLGWLAPAGRMALTNYVSQTVMLLVLFYGVGFGLVGRVGALYCVLIAVAFFVVQCLLSRWWLNRFRFGPLEWAWRSLTYGRIQALRVSRD